MEEQVNRLVEKTWGKPTIPITNRDPTNPITTAKLRSIPNDARLLVAVSGIPGSGKTGLAKMMATRINQLYEAEHPSSPLIATSLPMDGYHLTRAQLAAMPDPENAFARRGAAFTFDGEKYLQLVQALRKPVTAETGAIYAPSFDHAVKDPVEDDIPIAASCRAVFFEGNYLSLGKEPWSLAAGLMDELWFVEVDFETARKRLIQRHVEAGIAKDEDEADKRARENDLVNGREIVDWRLEVQEVVGSRFDSRWE